MAYILSVAIVALYEVDNMSGVAVSIIGVGCEGSTGDCAFNSVSRDELGVNRAVWMVTRMCGGFLLKVTML